MKILFAVLTMFFINELTVFGFENVFGTSDGHFMLEFIAGALLTGLGLLRLTFRHKWKYE
jgi:hypothetical protein